MLGANCVSVGIETESVIFFLIFAQTLSLGLFVWTSVFVFCRLTNSLYLFLVFVVLASFNFYFVWLRGEMAPEVNVGAEEIVRSFLGDPSSFPLEHIRRLQSVLSQFIAECRRGLSCNELYGISDEASREFHDRLVQGLSELSDFFRPYIEWNPPTDTERN